MSAPPTSCPAEIIELMTITTVMWEQALTTDLHAQWSYAAPVEMNCWLEGEGYGSGTGTTISRANFDQTILQQTRRPELDMYFDGDDARARSFTMNDRFTPLTTANAGVKLMPTAIETFYGPNYDNEYPWLIKVGF